MTLRRALSIALACIVLAVVGGAEAACATRACLVASVLGGGGFKPPAGSYLGLVATRGRVLTTHNASFSYANGRSFHYVRTGGPALTRLQVLLPCWYSNNGENSSGGPITWRGWIEYPAGVDDGDFKFSGSSSGTCNDTNLLSDVLTLHTPIPNGSTIYWRPFEDAHLATTGILEGLSNLTYAAGGDAVNVSATVIPPLVAPNNPSATGGTGIITPLAFIGYTTLPSVAVIGDSRAIGLADTADASGDMGELERSIGPYYGYSNLASSGENAFFASAVPFGGSPTFTALRRALAPYVTDLIGNYGSADLGSSQTLATIKSAVTATWLMLGSVNTYQVTFAPATSSINGYLSPNDQTVPPPSGSTDFTPIGATSIWGQANTWLKTTPAGLGCYFDLANTIEQSTDSGNWIVSPSPPYTTDGVHELRNAALVEMNSGVIDHTKIIIGGTPNCTVIAQNLLVLGIP